MAERGQGSTESKGSRGGGVHFARSEGEHVRKQSRGRPVAGLCPRIACLAGRTKGTQLEKVQLAKSPRQRGSLARALTGSLEYGTRTLSNARLGQLRRTRTRKSELAQMPWHIRAPKNGYPGSSGSDRAAQQLQTLDNSVSDTYVQREGRRYGTPYRLTVCRYAVPILTQCRTRTGSDRVGLLHMAH